MEWVVDLDFELDMRYFVSITKYICFSLNNCKQTFFKQFQNNLICCETISCDSWMVC